MKKLEKIRVALLCLSVFIILGVIAVAFSEKKKQVVIKADKPRETSVDASVELRNVSYSTTNKDNFKEWDLKAALAWYFKDEKRVVLEDLTVNMYRPDGKIFYLKGKRGELNTETRDIRIEGGTEGTMPDGTGIKTESILYEHDKRLITTEDKISITRGEFFIEGLGMQVDLNTEKLSLLNKVKARVNK